MRLELSYQGTDFAGWARQPGQRTVQGAVEQALATVLRAPAELTVAGRTDAGVHATGQVAHCDLPSELWQEYAPTLRRRLAGVLPPDVRVRHITAAEDGFDARFSALSREYAYRIAATEWGVEPLRRFDTLHWPGRLDLAAMQQAVPALLGEHDFAAFCRPREGATTIRTLHRLEWTPDDDVLVAAVEADAFCRAMVRSLVGAVLSVGAGRQDPSWPAEVLAGKVRDPRVAVAPAHGLTLVGVRYPRPDELAVQARRTRRRRAPRTIAG